MNDSNPPEANATPVKEFFVDILTQDVELVDTIPEFVDNSIDGAARQVSETTEYPNYRCVIDMDSSSLEITDNCGGIPLEVAEEYAFRFGRPDGLDREMPSKIGEFGIGMKRSLFKIGSYFEIESKTSDSHYRIEVNIEDWLNDKEKWDFPIEMLDEQSDGELDEEGTRILITDLRDKPSEKFGDESFESELAEKLTSKNRQYLNWGFEVILNRQNLTYRQMEIFQSDELEPAYDEFTFHTKDGDVDVKIVCGLGDKSNQEGGWYVFCNGRLVLEADDTATTGWTGEKSVEFLPKFHGQFNRFRGMVYFESDQSGTLPWNTTKTGVNEDSEVFQKARQKMISMARPVINFLNTVRDQQRELEDEDEEPELEKRVTQSEKTDIMSVESEDTQNFKGPSPKEEEEESADDTSPGTVRYTKPKKELERAMEELEVSSYRAVGEATFDYFWELEGMEE
ncbi:hypothetical protein G9C85_00230 [Halorubellus sp. JP-L1]|uniref:ATP-binding protein n=1 Tax=Halorubellus sp. JP-L1 TaxID=2715753 RepID=UPI00140B922F|nr:ATP-binding protein [Halorubellus sp. JP-L1]NHN40065.1 hypothetical protein [Halorubellus sp. JP-L1]